MAPLTLESTAAQATDTNLAIASPPQPQSIVNGPCGSELESKLIALHQRGILINATLGCRYSSLVLVNGDRQTFEREDYDDDRDLLSWCNGAIAALKAIEKGE